MGWTEPRTWTDTELVTKTIMDTHIKDNLVYLKDRFAFDTTLVFNAVSPTDWADLDLASEVGTNQAIVLLKVTCAGAPCGEIGFRKNGEGAELGAFDRAQGIAMIYLLANEMGYIIMLTDASGVIEWKSQTAVAISINMEAYWRYG